MMLQVMEELQLPDGVDVTRGRPGSCRPRSVLLRADLARLEKLRGRGRCLRLYPGEPGPHPIWLLPREVGIAAWIRTLWPDSLSPIGDRPVGYRHAGRRFRRPGRRLPPCSGSPRTQRRGRSRFGSSWPVERAGAKSRLPQMAASRRPDIGAGAVDAVVDAPWTALVRREAEGYVLTVAHWMGWYLDSIGMSDETARALYDTDRGIPAPRHADGLRASSSRA